MSKRGWIEGKNITIEYRFAELKSEHQEALAEELVRWKADFIVAAGGGPSAARKVTTRFPLWWRAGWISSPRGLLKVSQGREGMSQAFQS